MVNSKQKIKNYFLKEEAPAMSAGAGGIAGIGVGPDGEPGVTPTQASKYKADNYRYTDDIEEYVKKMANTAHLEFADIEGEDPAELRRSDRFHNHNLAQAQERIMRLMSR